LTPLLGHRLLLQVPKRRLPLLVAIPFLALTVAVAACTGQPGRRPTPDSPGSATASVTTTSSLTPSTVGSTLGGQATATTATSVTTTTPPSTEASTEPLSDGSFVCRPAGPGPFAAVLYNHGGRGDALGGDLRGTCEALAAAGYVARAERRPATMSLTGHLEDVLAGLDALRSRQDVDADRVAMIGFSRGGLLTMQAALVRPDQIAVAILLAPASGNGALEATLLDVSALVAPVHVFVSENDVFQDDHVGLAHAVESALSSADKTVVLRIYPPHGKDGHTLFFKVQEPYWSDVLEVLDSVLRD